MIEIFHVSDLHFGQSNSQDRKAAELLDGISRQFSFPGHDSRYLLVTGDLTQNGRKHEYKLAMLALSPFKDRIFLTPGNHDYGSLLGLAYSNRKARYFDDPFAESLGFSHSFFDKKVFTRLLQNRSGADALLMIGLNSCAKVGVCDLAQGKIGNAQLSELDTILSQCDTNIPRLLFLHHVPNRDAEREILMQLRDWRKLTAIVRNRVKVLAFGHEGRIMRVGFRMRPLRRSAMQLRKFAYGGEEAIVLDADSCVAEQSFYRIIADRGQIGAEVVRAIED